MEPQNPHLAVIGDRDALVWVLESSRVAFPRPRYHRIFPRLSPGDALYLYTTRGCYRNPTRDRGLVIGSATVTGYLSESEKPLHVRDRELPLEAPITITALAPVGEGIDLAEEVTRMSSFAKPESWSVYLRRSLKAMSQADAARFDRLLSSHSSFGAERISGYRLKAKVRAA